ncbi:MAG: hypothetical protein IRZ18_08890, partial [Clostridia bacterium]|nr:hypothetical protein [Clostridia bacterium]
MRPRRRVATVLAALLAANVVLLTGCSFQDAAESALRWFYRDSSSASAGAERPASETAPPAETGGSVGQGSDGQGSEGAQPGSETADGGAGTDAGGMPASEADGADAGDSGPFTTYTVKPANESPKDAALAKFLSDLKKAVAAKDAGALTALVDPDVQAGSGSDRGLDAFRTEWRLDANAADSPLWPLLGDMISLGGAFAPDDADAFVLPYASARFPGDLDARRYLVVTASGVNVRAQPSLDAPA